MVGRSRRLLILTDPEWKDKIITGYETWVYGYDPETKHQSAEWRCQGHRKRRQFKQTDAFTRGMVIGLKRAEDELWQMVEREWRAIPQDAIRTLIDSLPRRVAACIAIRGGPTCY
ncbi:Transposase [Cordylochernes scorpioides]|uniref:Transposase n=1 Tax=Cordylochernes scorpioides TaxID=51811 RepID=A0ABY6K385_9ARAC|nr:Transposase [Cordylochernes scorpioides]